MDEIEVTSPTRKRRPWLIASALVLVAVLIAVVVVVTTGGSSSSSNGGSAVVVMSPAPGATPYHDGQQIQVSVGPNSRFVPYSRIILIQCSDPGGQAENLPKSDIGCDGNTVPGYSTLVNKDGSFSNKFTLYSLPNTLLGEPADNAPVCNATHPCVLFVGEDQTNFTAPKEFSAPFTIAPSHTPKATS